jgi:hypothetical protein
MRSPAPPSRGRWRGWVVALSLLAVLAGAPAAAIELFDGRVQIHGYGEAQIRSIARDYDFDELDLTQWYMIGNVEFEFDIAPEGFGPIDLMGAYVRVEGRYDCVWNRACGMFNSVNTYGDRSQRLPDRLGDGRKSTFRGTLSPTSVRIDSRGTRKDFTDSRRRLSVPLGQENAVFAVRDPDPSLDLFRSVPKRSYTGRIWHLPALGQLFFGLPGLDPDGVDGNLNPMIDPGAGDDDVSGCYTGSPSAFPCRYAGAYVVDRFFDYRFGSGSTRGPLGGSGSTVLGPWRPKDDIIGWAALADRVSPYDEDSVHPVLVDVAGGAITGYGDLPFRPAPQVAADANGDGNIDGADAGSPLVSRGLYYPSSRLGAAIADSDFSQPNVNFDETDLAFNHGDAQEDTYELKEAYLDIEVLDHALWVRAGRQTIVWGKTELFRSQDQVNPQDLGLSSLPSLEESRIPLWGLRSIYSFYDLGPLEDVRLEGAILIDDFQPLDFGRCGEPYSPPQSCALAAGLFSHGLVGLGVAGQFLPDAPWEDADDFEGGLRLEWRWSRLSFALTNWVGYPDVPHLEILQEWERNVDPTSGRPRRAGATGPCVDGTEPSCFRGGIGSDDPIFNTFDRDGLASPETDDVLANHHANQQLFVTICASTVNTVNTVTGQPSACAFNSWNSQDRIDTPALALTFAQGFSAILQGHGFREAGLINGKVFFANLARWTTDGDLQTSSSLMGETEEDRMPLVPLHVNSNLPPGDMPAPPPLPSRQIDGWPVNGITFRAFPDVCSDANGDLDINACAPSPAVRERGLDPALSVQQEALMGCGPYWGTDCDIHGWDLLNAEGSALTQSWPGFEGTGGGDWDPFSNDVAQPGTIGFVGGPVCTRWDSSAKQTVVLPGCRGVRDVSIMTDKVVALYDPGYDLAIDGCVFAPSISGLPVEGVYPDGSPVDLSNCTAGPNETIKTLYHPFAGCLTPAQEAAGLECLFTDPLYLDRDFDSDFLVGDAQVFRSEMAALSWNLLMALVGSSTPPDKLQNMDCLNFDPATVTGGCSDRGPRFNEFDVNDSERLDGCSFRRPFLCKSAGPFFSTTGARRNVVRAGGNGAYGRRDFSWHAGAVAALDYTRRNVLGFSMDFPEDLTGTNWGLEFTWFDRVKMQNNDEFGGLSTTQHFNLSIAVDRPTFIRFLNPSRTFLLGSQVFLQYIERYKVGMPANGPLNALGTIFLATAYHQDRLIPTLTLVHEFNSQSGAAITGLTYRFSTHFSIGVGAAAFYGRIETARAPVRGIAGASGGAGEGSNRAYVENGLSSIRDRDELFLRFRYTF